MAGLLAATATSFAVEERLKLQDSPVLKTQVENLFSPKKGEAKIGFQLRREENIQLDIVDEQGTVVRHALGSGVFGQAFHQFAWDGRNDAGRIVPDGVYHVQLQLKDEDRTIEFPSTIRVDSTPPTIEQVAIKHRVFSPDGDHRADQVNVHYRFNEPAYAILFVDGKRVATSYRKKPVGTIQWYGRRKRPGRLPARARGAGSGRQHGGLDARVHRPAPLHRPLQAHVHASRQDPARPRLDRREDRRLAPRPNAREREAVADQASGAVEARPLHADRDRERPPSAGNRHRS